MRGGDNVNDYGGTAAGEGNGARGTATTSSKNSKISMSSKRAGGTNQIQQQAVQSNKVGSLPTHSNKSNSASNNQAYPYQSSSTKSGGPTGAANNNAVKVQKQQPQFQPTNLSIAKNFQQKGLN